MFRAGIAILACGVGVALSGCGAKEAAVVKGAFEKDIKSANIELDDVRKSDQQADELSLGGAVPVQRQGRASERRSRVEDQGRSAQADQGRLISTGKNAFVEYGGETYEVGEDKIAELKKQGATARPAS